MPDAVIQQDDLVHKLRVRRLLVNQRRMGVGLALGLFTVELLRAATRMILGQPEFWLPLWMSLAFSAALGAMLAFSPALWDRQILAKIDSPGWHGRVIRRWLLQPSKSARGWAFMLILFVGMDLVMWMTVSMPAYRNSFGYAIAVGLIWGGLRWRDGDELVCARCEYPKTPESKDICPECGNAWTDPDALNLGRVRTVPWMIIAGAIVIGIDLVLVALNG